MQERCFLHRKDRQQKSWDQALNVKEICNCYCHEIVPGPSLSGPDTLSDPAFFMLVWLICTQSRGWGAGLWLTATTCYWYIVLFLFDNSNMWHIYGNRNTTDFCSPLWDIIFSIVTKQDDIGNRVSEKQCGFFGEKHLNLNNACQLVSELESTWMGEAARKQCRSPASQSCVHSFMFNVHSVFLWVWQLNYLWELNPI